MKKPQHQGTAASKPKSFVRKYRIGKGGDVNKIPSDETGVCECTRYCDGGKVVDGATFRRHYGKSTRKLTKEEQDGATSTFGKTTKSEKSCPLVENLASIPGPSVPVLLSWFEAQGIWVHESLEIRQMGGEAGISVYAKDVGSPQQVVCKIPRSAILSSHTTPFAALLPRKTRSQIPPIVLLSLSLLYEFLLGRESRYWGYLQSLPRRHVPIVPLWDVEFVGGEDGKLGREMVRGTSVDAELKRIRKDGHGLEDLHMYYQATVDSFPKTTFSPVPPSFLDMLYTYSLVSSRAFQVDVYHGAAIVPLADAFNHQELNNVCFESDDFVCEDCGSLPTCEHDEIEGVEPRWTDESGTASENETISIASRLCHLPLEIIRSLFDPRQNTLDLTVKTPFEPGQEVYNTYGEGMGWAKQACEWGFVDGSIEGDGALGRGLKWELSDLMTRDDENYENAKEAWKLLCRSGGDSIGKEELTHALAEGAGDTGDSLFFSPSVDESAKDTLLLNEEGQISYSLFWALVCMLEPAVKDRRSSALKLDALARRLEQSGDDPATQATRDRSRPKVHDTDMAHLVRQVITLFESRVATTWRADLSAADLCDMLDHLSGDDHYLRRMALKILISERRVLEVAIARWKDIAEMFD